MVRALEWLLDEWSACDSGDYGVVINGKDIKLERNI